MKKALILSLLLALVGCTLFPTKVGDILTNSRKYDGKVVTIKGSVTSSVNLLAIKWFTLKDETGEIAVVTERAVPREGEIVSVKGTVNQAFQIAGKSVVVILEGK